MKYTKKYPIHEKPEKQFSGASIFANGGKLPGDDETKIVAKYNKTVPGLKEQQEQAKKWATKYLKNEPTVFDQVKDERDNAQYYLDQVAKDKSQEPKNAQGLATGQADLSPIDPIDLIGPGLLKLGAKAASKAPGLIKQAYKVNPYAFKPDPKAAYRMIGEEGYTDALESGVIRAKPSAGKWNSQTGSVEMGTPNYDAPYFSYGKPWDKDLVKGKPWMGYKGPYMAELKNEASLIENDLAYSTGQNNVYKPTRTIPTNDPNLKLYKEHWLQGYKEVPKPVVKNTTPIKSAELSKDLEPYLSKKVTPMTKEEEVFNSFLSPQGQAKNTMKRTKKYDSKGKEIFAFGGFKYPNGGSFYDSSNLNTSKPKVNTVPSSYTEQFAGNTSSAPGGYSPNYGGYAAAATGAIPSVVNTWNNPNLTTTGKMQDTSTTVGRTAATTTFPVLGAAFGLQDMGTQIAADNSGGKYVTNKDTGKQEAVLDTTDQIGTNMLTDTGSTTGKNWSNIVSGKGTSQDWWSGIMGTILPGTEYIVNNAYAVKNEGSANQEQYNAEQAAKMNYLKDQKSQNFAAFGGYKNKFPYGGQLPPGEDSLRHQAAKTMKYEKLRGSAYGTGLSNYGNPALGNNPSESQAVDWYMNNIAPKTKNYNSAMEKGEAGDFIYNTGKNPEVYQYQEYLRSIGKLKSSETWDKRKTISQEEMDSLYQADIAKLPENERRVLMNKGRDWYYQNINKKPDGSPSDAYNNTWYGRIWNTNDYTEFNSNNPKFTPNQKAYGGNMKSEVTGQSYLKDQVSQNYLGDEIHAPEMKGYFRRRKK